MKESGKAADSHYAYGHGKIENVSGTIEAALIFVAALMIIYEAIQKVQKIIGGEGGHVSDLGLGLGVLIMGVSGIINLIVSIKLMSCEEN